MKIQKNKSISVQAWVWVFIYCTTLVQNDKAGQSGLNEYYESATLTAMTLAFHASKCQRGQF